MESSKQKLKSDLANAVNVLLQRQRLDRISPQQYFQLECLVLGENSLHQLPTGAGKTWAAVRRE
jgi:replicative superfamily II helicase